MYYLASGSPTFLTSILGEDPEGPLLQRGAGLLEGQGHQGHLQGPGGPLYPLEVVLQPRAAPSQRARHGLVQRLGRERTNIVVAVRTLTRRRLGVLFTRWGFLFSSHSPHQLLGFSTQLCFVCITAHCFTFFFATHRTL